jgi:hypothetical protein
MKDLQVNGFGPSGVIFCAFFTFAAMACAGTYSGGSGTSMNPYKISTVADWQELIATSADWSKRFILLNDIDFGGANLTPVAPDTNPNISGPQGISFKGIFNGNGHVLRNAVINLPEEDYVGFFGWIGIGAQIQNLGIEDIAVTGDDRVGGLCGYNLDGLIKTCYSTGDVSGFGFVGGLCGENSCTISECYATGDVSGNGFIGGLCGHNNYGTITGCYALGTVGGDWSLGGLCGGSDGTIRDCYAICGINGGDVAGGLVGGAGRGGMISFCYSAGMVSGDIYVGGCIGGKDSSTITGCFWDTQTSGQSQGVGEGSSDGVPGKTTAEMKTRSTFTDAGWDFVGETANGTADIWRMGADGAGYPRLAWEPVPNDPKIPCVTLSPKSFVFETHQAGVNPPPQSLTLTQTCDGPHDWLIRVDDSCEWLSVRLVIGDFDPSNKEYLSIDASGLAKGQYFGSLTVTIRYINTSITQTVDVELNVGVDQPSVYGGGTGTMEDPYQIWTAEQMNTIGLHPKDWDKHFALMADMDMSPYTGWSLNLIGEERYFWLWGAFSGTFDGRGHTLSGLTISKGCFVVGLFRGIVENGVVQNLGLISPTVVVSSDCGGDPIVSSYAGILAGTVTSGGRIENCWIEDGSVEAGNYVGCLAGSNDGTIQNCRVSGSVKGLATVGGLVGSNGGEISNCYSRCTVSGTSTVGGLSGNNYQGKMIHCYSTGKPTGTSNVGGLCGSKTTGGSYEDAGNFWDKETSEQTGSAGGVGKTTAEMKTQATFTGVGWDFVGEAANGTADIWRMCGEGVSYPRLSWEFSGGGDFACPDGVGMEDLVYLAGRWMAGTAEAAGAADGDGNGKVDLGDYEILADNWMRE